MVVRHSEGGRAGKKLVSWVEIGCGDSDIGWKLELGTGTLSLEVRGAVRAEERAGRGGGDPPSGWEGTSGLVSADAQQQAARAAARGGAWLSMCTHVDSQAEVRMGNKLEVPGWRTHVLGSQEMR